MAELTTQEQTDLTTLEGKSFQFKFSQQLNQMSANLNGKISVTQESVDEFKSVKGSTIFKEDLKKAVDTDIWHQHLDDDGNELLDDDGNPTTIALETPRRLSTDEITKFVDDEYEKELSLLETQLAHMIEERRLIIVEQDFRARGLVTRDPIGTTYFQSFSGSDNNNGTTNATPYKWLNAFTETARSEGDIMICRRPRGGINPSQLGYGVVVGGATYGTSSQQSGFTAIPNTHSGTTIKTPQYIAGFEKGRNQDASNTSYDDDNGFIPNYIDRCADPRDRSLQGYWYNRYFSLSESYSERITFTSDGSGEDPIMVVADYENEWGDFIECANGKNGDDALNGSDTTANNARGGGYVVEYGSKIIRRTHDGSSSGAGKQKIPVHSYITPGDCIFIGSLIGQNNKPNVAPGVGDDPYEHSYIVRDVNYDKIVLWHPYKGEMAGEKRTVVSMGYQPRYRSIGYSGHDDDIYHSGNDTYCIDATNARNWLFQGITWTNAMYEYTTADHPERRKLMNFYGSNSFAFKDCQFIGGKRHNDSYPYYNRCDALWFITGHDNHLTADRCLFLNAKMGIYEYYGANTNTYGRGNTFRIRDCVFNGWNWSRVNGAKCETHWDGNENGVNNQYDSHAFNLPMGGIVAESSASQWEILDSEFVNHATTHIWFNSPGNQVKMRNLKFLGAGMDFVDPTSTTIYEAHENLGLRWARPAFAGGVTAYSDEGANTTNGGDPTVGMNDVSNGTTSSIVGTQVCKKLDPSSGLWVTANNSQYGRKFYTYLSTNIGDGDGGYTNVNETSYDANNYLRSNYQGAESITGGTVTTRSAYRRIGGANYTQRYNYYTGHERATYFNRFDNSTHKYDYTCYFGATALYGATDINPATGQMKLETGLEKWNYWWCTDITSNTVTVYDETKARTYDTDGAPNKVPKGQPFADELFAEYDWWVSHPTVGNWWYNNDYGQHNQYNNDRDQYRANFPRFYDSYRYRTMPAWNNLAVNSTDDIDGWGASTEETGNGPGQGIGASPWFGPVFCYYPNYWAYNGDFPQAGHNDYNHNTIAVQDYYHMYLNYDKDLNRSGDLYPEVFHPMIKGSRKGESTGISKNIVFQHGNKVQTWSGNSSKPYFTKGYGELQEPIMETVGQAMDDNNSLATILRSGGGSYVIKVYPTTYGFGTLSTPDSLNDLAKDGDAKHYGKWYDETGLKIFEYPFYLSTNARTYTVYLNRGLRTGSTYGWANDPTHYEVYLEMEYFSSKANSVHGNNDVLKRYQEHGERRKDRSSTGLAFQSGTGGWEALALTVTPETEGVGYLRLWWKKPKESNRANIFYVDPKVEVT